MEFFYNLNLLERLTCFGNLPHEEEFNIPSLSSFDEPYLQHDAEQRVANSPVKRYFLLECNIQKSQLLTLISVCPATVIKYNQIQRTFLTSSFYLYLNVEVFPDLAMTWFIFLNNIHSRRSSTTHFHTFFNLSKMYMIRLTDWTNNQELIKFQRYF